MALVGDFLLENYWLRIGGGSWNCVFWSKCLNWPLISPPKRLEELQKTANRRTDITSQGPHPITAFHLLRTAVVIILIRSGLVHIAPAKVLFHIGLDVLNYPTIIYAGGPG